MTGRDGHVDREGVIEMGGMHDGMGWWMLFGSVMFVLFWGGLIFLAVWLADQFRGRLSSEDRRPLDIARERYARGEITQEQLQEIRDNLRNAA